MVDADTLRIEQHIQRLPLAYILLDAEMRAVEWNPAAEKTFGYTKQEVLGRVIFDLILQLPMNNQLQQVVRRIRNGDMDAHNINENRTKDGRIITCEWHNTPLFDSDGEVVGAIALAQDISGRKNLEEQRRQAQKMEAIDELAGGIAHDFNNALTAINIYNHLLIDLLNSDDSAQLLLQEIKKVTERAASFTRQLLVFSRKQVLAPQILCLNDVVRDTEWMFRRVISEDIQLVTDLEPQLDSIKADPEQLEQVLLNLVLNARDAMPCGGTLNIETSNLAVDLVNCKEHDDIPPGLYVMLVVRDSGVGISPEVKRHIFEPFFTTKEPGTSSGLGLAVVQGILNQSEGHIGVESAPGDGACIKIYLPRVADVARTRQSYQELEPRVRDTATILLVEDDEAVRKAIADLLQRFGYTVLEASDGVEALAVSSTHRELISLLVTDVVMPRLGGVELAEQLLALRPKRKTLYISGHTNGAALRCHSAREPAAFLQKPFSPASLHEKIREVLHHA